jgi:hypothetical protein
MKVVDDATAAAIDSPERIVTASATVDWLNKGFYSEAPSTGTDYDLYEDFTSGTLSSDWSLSGTGNLGTYDSNKFQVVLPTSYPDATTLTYGPTIDARDKTIYVEVLGVPEANTTNEVRVRLYQDDTHYYMFRNDSGGFYVEAQGPAGPLQTWYGFAYSGVIVKAVGFSFNDGQIYTTVVSTKGEKFGLAPPPSALPIPITAGTLTVEAYTQDASEFDAIVSKVVVGPNLDRLDSNLASISVDRSLTGAFPDEVSFTEGSAAAQTDIDLVTGETDDERKHAAWLFSPFNEDSPFAASKSQRIHIPFNASINFQKADGTLAKFQRMVGTTRDFDVSVKDRTASLSALDYRDKLAGSVSFPLIDGQMQGCNVTSLLSFALVSAGVPVAPALDKNCKLYLPMHGTIAPMISGNPSQSFTRLTDNDSDDPQDFTNVTVNSTPSFMENPHSVQAVDAHWHSGDHQALVGRLLPSTDGLDVFSRQNAAGYFTAWFKGDSSFVGGGSPGTGSNPHGRFALSLWSRLSPSQYLEIGIFADGKMYMAFNNGSSNILYQHTTAMALDDQWHQLVWKFNLNAGPGEGVVQMNRGATEGLGWLSWDMDANFPSTLRDSLGPVDSWTPAIAEFALSVPMSDFQMASHPDTDPIDQISTPAFSDFNVLPYLDLELGGNVDTSPKEVWDVVTDIAGATRSSVYFDEDGNFNFVPISDRASTTSQTVQKTVTSVDHITELDFSQTVDSIKNTIRVDYTPFQAVRGGVAFSTTDTFVLPGRSTTILRLTFPDAVSYIVSQVIGSGAAPWVWDNAYAWPPDSNGDFHGMGCARASLTDTSNIKNILGMPYPVIVGGGGDYLDVSVQNPTAKAVYIFNDGQAIDFADGTPTGSNKTRMQALGSPSIMLAGNKLSQLSMGSIEMVDQYSIDKFDPQSFSFSNPYIQTREAANTLAGSLLSDLKDPVATARITVIGDPRLELGDRIRIQDPDGNVFDGEFWIQGIEDTLDDGGYTQQLTVRQAHSTLYWAVDTTHTPGHDRYDQFSWG